MRARVAVARKKRGGTAEQRTPEKEGHGLRKEGRGGNNRHVAVEGATQ